MLANYLQKVKERNPLVHNITNYVTVNDCANILLAAGASPIMADDQKEVEEITSICSSLNINLGTLNQRTMESMILAGKKANELGHSVLLDPVGVGASSLRNDFAKTLIREVKFSAIRGNVSEIKALFLGENGTRGVDAAESIDESMIDSLVDFAKKTAKSYGCMILITGKQDIITDGKKAYTIANGVKEMADITGSGCMLSALSAAFLGADSTLESMLSAFCLMGYAGEKALQKMIETDAGNASFRNYLIDEVYKMTGEELEKGAKYELK